MSDNQEYQALVKDLTELNQEHLLPHLAASSSTLLSELLNLGKHYHGGIQQYIRNAQKLLQQTSASTIEFSSLSQPPRVFHAPSLLKPSRELADLEEKGQGLLRKAVFVLVAGGLGERLGFSGIKLSLPVDTASSRTYLEHYTSWIAAVAGPDAPLVIMTSDDTHERTVAELARIPSLLGCVRIVKQETVPCLQDRLGRVAVTSEGKLLRKPHGHGDVHSLLFSARSQKDTALVDEWLAEGKQYIVFLQDTNASSVLTIPVSLAISEREGLAMNLTCVPRMPKEAIGLLCHVGVAEATGGDGKRRTVNIEYNKFEPVAQHFFGHGDVAAPGSPFSSFPGSINTLLFRLDIYAAKLRLSNGQVPEFINPKYADSQKTVFKTPSRVESLMQDFALLFDNEKDDERVGGVVFERDLYHPVKNSLAEGVAKIKEGVDAHCAATGEENVLKLLRKRLRSIGVDMSSESLKETTAGVIPVSLLPVVSIAPSIAASFRTLLTAFPSPSDVKISDRSVLIVEGDVEIRRLELDGTLIIKAMNSGTKIIVDGLIVSNAGWKILVGDDALGDGEVHRMRGYVFAKEEKNGGDAAVFVERSVGTFFLCNGGLSRM
jgi:UDP-sugar pyrophosphorylase